MYGYETENNDLAMALQMLRESVLTGEKASIDLALEQSWKILVAWEDCEALSPILREWQTALGWP